MPSITSAPISNRKFGIELEIAVPMTINSARLVAEFASIGVQLRAESYNHDTRNYWKLVPDGSIRAAGKWCVELVSPPLSGPAGLEQVRKVCEVLTRLEVTANRTCGFHVHHSANDFKSRHFEHLFSLYRNCERELDRMMPESRRGNNNRFCKSLKTRSVSLLMSDRFHKLNLCSFQRHGTVEFRHHSGTVNPDKVVNWVLFTNRMVERAKRKVNAADHDYTWYDVKQLLGLVHTDVAPLKGLAEYYDGRRTRLVETTEQRVARLAARRAARRAAAITAAQTAYSNPVVRPSIS